MNKPKVSVIIRCYNEEEHIGKLLVGLGKQSLKDHEIIIVDSGSTDDTLQIAQRFPCKIVHINPGEFSFGRALNMGCRASEGEILVFASAHVYPVYSDWLESIAKPFENPKVGLVYGKQRGNQSTRYSEKQIFAGLFPESISKSQEGPFCNNANCAILKSLWEQQPYDEDLTGLEDLQWAERIQKKDYKIYYSSEAEIIHVHDESPAQILNRYRREAIALKRIYPQQSLSFISFLRLFLFNTIADYFHAILDRVLIKNILSIPSYRFMQFWGAYMGFKRGVSVTESLKHTFYYPRTFRRAIHSGENRTQREKISYEAT